MGLVLVLDFIVEGMEAIDGSEQEHYMETITTSTVWEIEWTAVWGSNNKMNDGALSEMATLPEVDQVYGDEQCWSRTQKFDIRYATSENVTLMRCREVG